MPYFHICFISVFASQGIILRAKETGSGFNEANVALPLSVRREIFDKKDEINSYMENITTATGSSWVFDVETGL